MHKFDIDTDQDYESKLYYGYKKKERKEELHKLSQKFVEDNKNSLDFVLTELIHEKYGC